MQRENVLAILKLHQATLKTLGVRSLALFGSKFYGDRVPTKFWERRSWRVMQASSLVKLLRQW